MSLNNLGGCLNSKTAQTPEQAAEAAIAMIEDAGVLYEGDTIVITADEDSDD